MLRHYFWSTAALAGVALLAVGPELQAQCCHRGSAGARGLQTQALQTQLLQAQLLQAQVLQAQLSQAALANQLNVLQASQRPLDRQLTAGSLSQGPKSGKMSDEAAAGSLAKQLIQGTPTQRQQALTTLTEREGDAYTRALTNALSKLRGEMRARAQAALAKRTSPPPAQ
jgi:hypothetical protein